MIDPTEEPAGFTEEKAGRVLLFFRNGLCVGTVTPTRNPFGAHRPDWWVGRACGQEFSYGQKRSARAVVLDYLTGKLGQPVTISADTPKRPFEQVAEGGDCHGTD